jgi:glucose-1-phosphate thymidylyltransferase
VNAPARAPSPIRGVVLAGGTGRRLLPLTRVTNKHLLPVGREPMIFHPVRKLVEAGLREILVVTGVEHMGHVVGSLGSGSQFGCELSYRVQDEAGGIAQALGLARGFAAGGPVLVLLGDNVFEDALGPEVDAFLAPEGARGRGARILLKRVLDPARFGVPVFDEADPQRILRIEEKPARPASSYAVTGIYMYDASVYEIIGGLRPSVRGELEISDVNNAYLARGELRWGELRGFWTDAGTHETLALANRLLGGTA